MSSSKTIKRLFKESRVTASLEVNGRIIDDSLLAYRETDRNESIAVHSNIWGLIMKHRMTSYSVAGALAICLALVSVFLLVGPTENISTALGEVVDNLRHVPFMHTLVTEIEGDRTRTHETWHNFQEGKMFIKYDMAIWCFAVNEKKEYFCRISDEDPSIRVRDLDEGGVYGTNSAITLVQEFLESAKNNGHTIKHRKDNVEGVRVDIYETEGKQDGGMSIGSRKVSTVVNTLIVDSQSSLLISFKHECFDKDTQLLMSSEGKISYPLSSPKDIYDLGIPRDTRIEYEESKE